MYLFSKIMNLLSANIWERLLKWYQNSLIKEMIDYFAEQVFRVDFRVYDNFSVGAQTGVTVKNVILGIMLGAIVAACAMAYTRRVHGRFVRTLLRRGAHSPETAITLREAGLFCNPSVRRALLGGVLSKLTRCVETEEYLAAHAEKIDGTATGDEGAAELDDTEPYENREEPSELATETIAEAVSSGSSMASEGALGDDSNDVSNDTEATDGDSSDVRGLVVVDGFTPDLLTARFYIPEALKYRAEVRYEQRGSGILPLILTVVACIAIAILLCRFLPSLLGLADGLINVFS